MRCFVVCCAVLSNILVYGATSAACTAFVHSCRDCNEDIKKRRPILQWNNIPSQSLVTQRRGTVKSRGAICVVRRGHVMSLSDSVQLSETMQDTKFDTPTQESLLHNADKLWSERCAHVGGAAALSLLIVLSYWQWMA